MMRSSDTIVNKYNIPGPRYTSYPTVPYWKPESFSYDEWLESVKRSFKESNTQEGISIYIHLPFCESLCTFCACHKRITKRHDVEGPYIEVLLKEWEMYCELFDDVPLISELHLGGGTPTFFSPENLKILIEGILERAKLNTSYELSFEAHPNNTTTEHLEVLFDLGFRRTSFGVQDYDLKVQKTINRVQPFEKVREVTFQSRAIGYESINQDLVFGLPHQSLDTMKRTIELTNELKPDRIAFYSYAHVPWIKNVGQRGYSEKDLPSAELKRELYELGKKLLDEQGYVEIGMDHFALKDDSLYTSAENKSLHRNFMGYTANKTQLMIGLGMSSISDSWYGFAQNLKTVEEYTAKVREGLFPVFRGHLLNKEDLIIRQHILNIMCHFETDWKDEALQFEGLDQCLERLNEMQLDGLVELHENGLRLPDHARPFVRNVCMAFDLHLVRDKPQTRIFSMTI